jgi:hypothetical protein
MCFKENIFFAWKNKFWKEKKTESLLLSHCFAIEIQCVGYRKREWFLNSPFFKKKRMKEIFEAAKNLQETKVLEKVQIRQSQTVTGIKLPTNDNNNLPTTTTRVHCRKAWLTVFLLSREFQPNLATLRTNT